MISSQDFQNSYEKFYDAMRQYLWPYDVLEVLAQVEVDIYSAFIDREKLSNDFSKLKTLIRETLQEDDYFSKVTDKLSELIDDEDRDSFYSIYRVSEVNQENDKVLKYSSNEDESEELAGGISNENKTSGIM